MITGMDELEARVDEFKQQVRRAVAEGLSAAADGLLVLQQEMVPFDTGALYDSGTTAVDDVSLTAAVGFGYSNGPNREIVAVVQHEDLTLNHPTGGQAKYAETPASSYGAEMAACIASELEAIT